MLIDLASYKNGKWMPGRNEAADDYFETIDDELDISDGYFLIPVEINRSGARQMIPQAVPIMFFLGTESMSRQMKHTEPYFKKQVYDDINRGLSAYAVSYNNYLEELALRHYVMEHAAYRHRKSC